MLENTTAVPELEVAVKYFPAGVNILKLDKSAKPVQVKLTSLNLTESLEALTLKANNF